jgi:hypothetical protein
MLGKAAAKGLMRVGQRGVELEQSPHHALRGGLSRKDRSRCAKALRIDFVFVTDNVSSRPDLRRTREFFLSLNRPCARQCYDPRTPPGGM